MSTYRSIEVTFLIKKGICFLTTLLIIFSVSGQHNSKKEKEGHKTGLNDTINISKLRPRIFVRSDQATIGQGLTVTALRSRLNDPEYSQFLKYGSDIDGWESLPGVAMRYLLDGKKENAVKVGEYISNTPFPFKKEHTTPSRAVYFSAIAFDWVRDGLPQPLVDKILIKLVEGGEFLKVGVEDPEVNHNYTFVSMYGLSMVALAIYGENEQYDNKTNDYLKMIDKLLLDDGMLMDTFKEKQGSWGEGDHYAPYVVIHPFLMVLKALTTATGTDYFKIIRDKYDNFLAPMSKFLVANIRPDFTFQRIGDVTAHVVPYKTFFRPTLALLASELNNTELQGQIHSFSQAMSQYYGEDLTHDLYKWMMLAFYDAKLPLEPSYKTLPLAQRFGPSTYEQITFRNKWGTDGTLINYISGDHYTDHQHFDKGSFLIYDHGALAVDAGAYSGMYESSWSNYSVRTLAHNGIVIDDPSQPIEKNVKGLDLYPDGGQRVIRGAQTHKSWQDYLKISKEYGLNTADVLAYDSDSIQNRYNYVKSNLTHAYGDNVDWMDRQLLYLPKMNYLVVKDRVITKTPLKTNWLLHFEQRPLIDNKQPPEGVTDYPNDSIVVASRTGQVELGQKNVKYSGRLFVKNLLPDDRTISIIGGKGYEYYNRFAKKNFPPEDDKKERKTNRESGHWRMEVTPKRPNRAIAFLNVMEITDTSKNEMLPTEYLSSEMGKMGGALFRSEQPYVVLFSNSLNDGGDALQKAQLPITYTIDVAVDANHVLAELPANTKVEVLVDDKQLGMFTTSKAGVLFFSDAGKGKRTITIRPVK